MVVGKGKRQDAALRALLDGAPEPDVSKFADLVGNLPATGEVENSNEETVRTNFFLRDLNGSHYYIPMTWQQCAHECDMPTSQRPRALRPRARRFTPCIPTSVSP